MLNNKKVVFGLFAMLGYCIVSAFSRVLGSDLAQTISPDWLCFSIFLIATIVFLLVNCRRWRVVFCYCKKNIMSLIILNTTTFIAWFFLIYPLKFLEPSIVSSLTLGTSPIVVLLLSTVIYKEYTLTKSDLSFSVALFLIISYLAMLCFLGLTGVDTQKPLILLGAFFCCLVSGISLTVGNLQTKRISSGGMKPLDILCVRFILLLLLSGLFCFHSPIQWSFATFSHITLLSLTMVIIPLYLMQVAIRDLQPITVAVISPLMPTLAFFMEFFDARIQPHLSVFLGVFGMLICILAGTIYRYQQEV